MPQRSKVGPISFQYGGYHCHKDKDSYQSNPIHYANRWRLYFYLKLSSLILLNSFSECIQQKNSVSSGITLRRASTKLLEIWGSQISLMMWLLLRRVVNKLKPTKSFWLHQVLSSSTRTKQGTQIQSHHYLKPPSLTSKRGWTILSLTSRSSPWPEKPARSLLAKCVERKAQGRHIESMHISGVSHNCDFCDKVTRSRDAMRQQKRTHSLATTKNQAKSL